MKYYLAPLVIILVFSACKAGTQKESDHVLKKSNAEETALAASPDPEGIYMKAVIDGQEWIATKMIPEYSEGSNYKTVHGETDDYSITFNIYKPTAGVKRELNEDYAISLMTNEGFYGGRKGTVEILMADEYWIEGRFEFIANTADSEKIIRVTDGFFRVATTDPDKN